MNVGELRALLAEHPDHLPVEVSTEAGFSVEGVPVERIDGMAVGGIVEGQHPGEARHVCIRAEGGWYGSEAWGCPMPRPTP